MGYSRQWEHQTNHDEGIFGIYDRHLCGTHTSTETNDSMDKKADRHMAQASWNVQLVCC